MKDKDENVRELQTGKVVKQKRNVDAKQGVYRKKMKIRSWRKTETEHESMKRAMNVYIFMPKNTGKRLS